jgi:ABC-type multidrug transport system ATPase subunit
VLGPSGSGKTTFLNILAHRVSEKHTNGAVTVNDEVLTKEISKEFGYVMQDDVLHENLTVREVLLIIANLYNHDSVDFGIYNEVEIWEIVLWKTNEEED